MKRSSFPRSIPVVLALALALSLTATAGAQGSVALYDALPSPLPGNVASLGYEATQTDEFGDRVVLAEAGWLLDGVRVTLSSWGCESGAWNTGDCSTTPGATFDHPLTINLYTVDGSTGEPDQLLATQTDTVAIPYRPSADSVNCTGGQWWDGANCFNGLAVNVDWDLSALAATLPDKVVWAVAYNTTHSGNAPIGEGAACYTEPGGCGYDSLNVGALTVTPIAAGQDDLPDGAVWDTAIASWYCDGGAGGTDTLRVDSCAGAWTSNRPLGAIFGHNPLVGGRAAGDIASAAHRSLQVPQSGGAGLPAAALIFAGVVGAGSATAVAARRRRA